MSAATESILSQQPAAAAARLPEAPLPPPPQPPAEDLSKLRGAATGEAPHGPLGCPGFTSSAPGGGDGESKMKRGDGSGEEDGAGRRGSPSPATKSDSVPEDEEQHAAVRKHLSNGLGDASAFQDLTRHRLGLLRTDPNSNEASKLLRGILQGKEKRLQDSMNHFAHNGGLIGDPHSADGGLITKLLQQEREGRNSVRKNSFDSEDGSLSPDVMSDNNSEHDNNDQKDDENSLIADEDKDKSRDDCGSTGSNNDSLEAKRARVENIISGMRTSPSHAEGASAGAAERKPKRKQYTPQQHANTEEPSPKARKVEKEIIEHQLKNMQQQLSEMQQRYVSMFDMDPGMGHPEFSNYVMNLAENNRRFNEIRNAPKECKDRRMFSPERKNMTPSKLNFHETSELDPSHFIKEAGKLAKQQLNVGLVADTPEDLENLAKMLKAEISKSVGTLVDDIVSKYVIAQKQQLQLKKQQQEQQFLHQQRQQQQQQQLQQRPRSPMNDRSVINIVPDAPKPEKFHSPQMPPFARPFEDREPTTLNIPKPTKSKVTDKLIHPMIESHMRAFAELPRSMHHPLFPPPPYFPHGHMPPAMQPLFPKEPEQTEAIPLVVNTPKKKRTKVTDTRLSPRAARALLNEGSNGPLDFDKSQQSPHHHPLGFPHHLMHPEAFPHHPLVPVSLPTSVAIPNPSLQHSDVLAMYSHGDGGMFGDGSRPASRSPIAGDNGSPNMPHTPSEQSMPMSIMKGEDMFNQEFNGSFSSDGTNIEGLISFSDKKISLIRRNMRGVLLSQLSKTFVSWPTFPIQRLKFTSFIQSGALHLRQMFAFLLSETVSVHTVLFYVSHSLEKLHEISFECLTAHAKRKSDIPCIKRHEDKFFWFQLFRCIDQWTG